MEDVKEKSDVEMKDAPSSSSSKELSKSLPEAAFNNFLQGKRGMLVQDYASAVQSLAAACEMYVQHFGELAIECGEVYFLYGKALFRLSQQQAGILGGALNEAGSNEDENSSESGSKDNENESGENSDADGAEENAEPGEKGAEGENNETEADTEEKEPSESTDSPQAVVEENSSEAKAKEADNPPTDESKTTDASKEEPSEIKVDENQVTSTDENKPAETEEEIQEAEEDDLELAWNTLETAKSIFKRQENDESQLKVAEILQLLAEISMESDNNIAAINDLSECLKIQKKLLKPDDRILAETYYQMGLAQLLDKQYYEALENFKTTKQILELRVENLKNTTIEEVAGSFASADKDVEVSDLENILLDIQEKIEDTEELIRNTKKEIEDAFASEAVASPVKEVKEKGETSVMVKPVSNITHLLKRKKPEEATCEESSKRIKMSVPNGDTNVTSTENSGNSEGSKV